MDRLTYKLPSDKILLEKQIFIAPLQCLYVPSTMKLEFMNIYKKKNLQQELSEMIKIKCKS